MEWSEPPGPASDSATGRSMTSEKVVSDVPVVREPRKAVDSEEQDIVDTGWLNKTPPPATSPSRSASPDLTPPPSPSPPPIAAPNGNPYGMYDHSVTHGEVDVSDREDQGYITEIDAEKRLATVPSHGQHGAGDSMDHADELKSHSPSAPQADTYPHPSTPKRAPSVNDISVAQPDLHSTPQSACSVGIERVPFYSLTTPKRRCMKADFISPVRPLSVSQPISPQQPMPSFGESQYNQLGATMTRDPASQHMPEVEQVQTPRKFRAVSSEPPQSRISATSHRVARVEQEPEVTTPQQSNLLASSTISPHKPPEPPPLPAAPVDPALHQFRSARTFRTRTALQLQPYTRERAVYEAVLRRGGLKKGRHAIALPKDISSDEDDEEEGPDSSESATPPAETIVIGGTPIPPPKHREYRRVEIIDLDKSEYFLRHGMHPGSEEEVDASLQRIARKRVRAEKEEKRRQREERRREKEFASLLRGRSAHQVS